MRLACWPAAIHAFISSAGEPSDVTSPLKSLMATCFGSVGVVHVPWEMIPDAPSPRSWCTEREVQVMSLRTGFDADAGVHGFPAKERNDNSGRSKSHEGRVANSLAESLRRPSFRQEDIESGKSVRRFPANMHF